MPQPLNAGLGANAATQPASLGKPAAPAQTSAASGAFRAVFDAEVARQSRVELSHHAQARVAQRGLALDAAALERIGRALDKAQEKGGHSSLIVIDDVALVTNVPARRVVTALETREARERVFTNIDSVVFA